jgi:hypothetical protein
MPHVESTHPASETGHYFGTQHEYAQMFQMIFGATISQIVHTAALYSLPEHLAQGRATPAGFCQLVEANIVTRQTGTLPQSSPPFRRPAPSL